MDSISAASCQRLPFQDFVLSEKLVEAAAWQGLWFVEREPLDSILITYLVFDLSQFSGHCPVALHSKVNGFAPGFGKDSIAPLEATQTSLAGDCQL